MHQDTILKQHQLDSLDEKSLKVYLHYLTLDNDHLAPEQTELQTAQNFATR
jgi:hypothetical protein